MTNRRLDLYGLETAVTAFLAATGDDPSRHGLAATPRRVAELYAQLLAGQDQDPVAVLRPDLAVEPGEALGGREQLVVLRDVQFYSLCEHHLLPFFGVVHIGYYPGPALVGLSRLTRAVAVLARRLQLQERLTDQLAGALESALNPLGVAVMIEAEHLCVSMRDPGAASARLVTTAFRGTLTTAAAREDFRSAIGRR